METLLSSFAKSDPVKHRALVQEAIVQCTAYREDKRAGLEFVSEIACARCDGHLWTAGGSGSNCGRYHCSWCFTVYRAQKTGAIPVAF